MVARPERYRAAKLANSRRATNFTANNLARKGGIGLVWTSYLGEHLTFVGKAQLRIFRHASVLRQYVKSDMR
jgi:hypothetical protein